MTCGKPLKEKTKLTAQMMKSVRIGQKAKMQSLRVLMARIKRGDCDDWPTYLEEGWS